MKWYYFPDETDAQIELRYEDDSGTVHGPRDVPWPDAPRLKTAPDGWIVSPDVKAAAGEAVTDLYTDVNPLVALQALRDLAAGDVEEGTP